MKYWKGINKKEGDCGTMDDNGFVPDSIDCTKEDYEKWCALRPKPTPIIQLIKLKNKKTNEVIEYEVVI